MTQEEEKAPEAEKIDAVLKDKLRGLIADSLDVGVEQVTDDAAFIEDLGADSLDTVELVMAFESEFNDIDIPDTDAEKLTTVGGVFTYLKDMPKVIEHVKKIIADEEAKEGGEEKSAEG